MARILLAEDEEHIARLIEFKLKKEGLDVSIARNGKEALEALEKNSGEIWGLVILDVMMPICDGWQVLRQLRHSSIMALNEIPVLMLTAKNTETDIAKSAELGATRFLKKPFDPSELARVVKEMLAKTIWEADPEMNALRADFVSSFQTRRQALAPMLAALRGQATGEVATDHPVVSQVHVIAHNLAGIASTYGFTAIGKVSALVDDYLSLMRASIPAERLLRFSLLLDQVLESSGENADESILKEITSCVESLVSATKP
jgi:CheY-like chemotaxis protein